MNNFNRRKQRSLEKKLNHMIRQLCCWNCLQTGHKRFQCPFLKMKFCSFCRKPSVLTTECGCELSVLSIGHQNRRKREIKKRTLPFENDVIVPIVDEQNGSIGYRKDDNIAITIENEVDQQNNEIIDKDILEINADEELVNDFEFEN